MKTKIKPLRNLNYITFILFLSLLNLIFYRSSFSQEPVKKHEYKTPQFIIELSGSFMEPTGSSKGEVEDFFAFRNYGATYGLGFHLQIKYAANKKGSLFPYISTGFAQLQNDDNRKSFIDSNLISGGYPLPGSALYNSINGTSLLIIRSFFAGVGLQYVLNSKSTFIPFAGIELNYNYIWGYYIQNPTATAGNNVKGQTTFDINGTSRFGFGIGIGSDFRISKYLGFVIGTKYKMDNLIGKQSDRTTGINTMNLLDKSAENLNTNLNKNRNIEYLEFYFGFTVFAGSR